MQDRTTESYVVALNMLKRRLDSIVYIPEITAQRGPGRPPLETSDPNAYRFRVLLDFEPAQAAAFPLVFGNLIKR